MNKHSKSFGSLLAIGLATLCVSVFVGCRSEEADPMMTGSMNDWVGHSSSDLEVAMGHPTRIIPRPGGAAVWEYITEGNFVSPKEMNTVSVVNGAQWAGGVGSKGAATTLGGFGATGAATTTEKEQRLSHYQNLWRFAIQNGKITDVYTERSIDGSVVQARHYTTP